MSNNSWKNDTEYEEHKIAQVKDWDDSYVMLERIDRCCINVPKPKDVEIKPGDTARFFGKGMGFSVRGVVILPADGGESIVLYYSTEEEAEVKRLKDLEESNAARKKEYEESYDDNNERISKLPEVYQDRINNFRLHDKDWGWNYESYELFACEESVKIAEHCKTAKGVMDFHKSTWDEQVKVVSDSHSGNTMGFACALAKLYIDNPDLVPKYHGAMCPLCGCKEYGCWSSRPEAEIERQKRGVK